MKNLNATPTFHLGRHLLAEFYDCNPNVLNNPQLIEQIMTDGAVRCGATVVQKNFHLFNPYGVSGVVIIAESHLAIHTWPEYGYAAVDLFTCGDACNPDVAYDHLKTELGSGYAVYSELKRGLMNADTQEMVKMPFVIDKEAGEGVLQMPERVTHIDSQFYAQSAQSAAGKGGE